MNERQNINIHKWGNTMELGIDFTDGTTVITTDWDTMRQYVNGGNVTMVLVRASGEILYDVRDGWDIVSRIHNGGL